MDNVEFEPLPGYGDLFTVAEFANDVKHGMFIPDDGSGYWATATQMSRLSVWRHEKPDWATHVAWFNK